VHIKILPDGPIIMSIHSYEHPILTMSSKSGFKRHKNRLLSCGWTIIDDQKWVLEAPYDVRLIFINGWRYYQNQIVQEVTKLLEQYWDVPHNHHWSTWRMTIGFNYRNPGDPRNSDYMQFAENYAREHSFQRLP